MIPPKEIFLSHSSHNQDVAEAISDTIKNHGIPVWYAPQNIRLSQQWHDEIGRALKRCDWFMLLLSPESVDSRWVRQEYQYALNHNQYNGKIIPIKICECDHEELSWTLGNFQIADYFESDQGCYEEILNTWGVGFDQDLMR